jgi:hypothetical protein
VPTEEFADFADFTDSVRTQQGNEVSTVTQRRVRTLPIADRQLPIAKFLRHGQSTIVFWQSQLSDPTLPVTVLTSLPLRLRVIGGFAFTS